MKYLDRLIDKVVDFLDRHITTSKHPENIYVDDKRYTRKELELGEQDMENITGEVDLLRQQRSALGVPDGDKPLDDKDKIIERATKKYLNSHKNESDLQR